MRRTFRKTMLIVCEGTKTEPLYFNILRDEAISKGIWDNVVIVPEPPRFSLEKEDNRSKNKKRAFKILNILFLKGRIKQQMR